MKKSKNSSKNSNTHIKIQSPFYNLDLCMNSNGSGFEKEMFSVLISCRFNLLSGY